MYYIVVSNEIWTFCSRSEAEKFYADKEADGLQPFATQDRELARLISYDTSSLF
jgi:hypothetical protein